MKRILFRSGKRSKHALFAGTHSKIAYHDVNKKIERLTKIFGINEISAIIMDVLPALLATIVNYFVLDLGKGSFNLYFFTWFVTNDFFIIKIEMTSERK